MYIPKHFTVSEMVPPEIGTSIQAHGDNWTWAVLFDERLLRVMDDLRDSFGPMLVNDWANGGGTKYRGFRPPGCGVGSMFSQHKFGRAVDMIPKDHAAESIRKFILKYPLPDRFKDIGAIEMGISWLHIDVRQRVGDEILTFYP